MQTTQLSGFHNVTVLKGQMNSKRLLFGTLGICFLFLCLYALIAHKVDQDIAVKIEAASLQILYNKWVSEGRPSVYEPSNYVTSTTAYYAVHTNTYMYKNIYVKSIISAKSKSIIEPGFLVISEDGLIYWVGKSNSIKPISLKVKRKG